MTKRRLHPSRKQLVKYYLPGVILAIVGISIYSFLQTKTNYWVLHSIWHICMASSIVFFLPKRDRGDSNSSSVSSSTPAGDNLKSNINFSVSLLQFSFTYLNSFTYFKYPYIFIIIHRSLINLYFFFIKYVSFQLL